MAILATELQTRLRGRLPSDRILVEPQGRDVATLCPETGAELSQLLATVRELQLLLKDPTTRRTSGKYYVGLDLNRLSRILDLDVTSHCVTIQSGVTLGSLEQWLVIHGWSLGWVHSGLEQHTVAEVLQSSLPTFPSPRYTDPIRSVRGYQGILPSGGEVWNKTGPARATGPNLLGMFSGGYELGVLTRIVFSIHPVPTNTTVAEVTATSPQDLLSLAGLECRSPHKPHRILVCKLAPKRKKQRWKLVASWNDSEAAAQQFADRTRFRGHDPIIHRGCDPDVLEEYAPRTDNFFTGIAGKIPDELLSKMERSPARWIIGFRNAHELQLWPHSEDHADPDDITRKWFHDQNHDVQEQHKKLRKSLIQKLTIDAENTSRESV
ncbi:MAG: hypothetical protein CMH54_07090 [Myxococcales bacterium]|nr:hypothetical protein [Myxococcales bacterium]